LCVLRRCQGERRFPCGIRLHAYLIPRTHPGRKCNADMQR
jgi:hypothetical protein